MKRAKRPRRASEVENRRKSLGNSRPSILILTEGKNSEPDYFKLLSNEFNLGYEVEVKSLGYKSAPMNLVEHLKDKLLWNEYNCIYCVFDKDRHSSFQTAIDTIKQMSMNKNYGKIPIKAITSVPCFEYWLLLHVSYTARSFYDAPSPCNAVEHEMKGYAPFNKYSKTSKWMHSNFDNLKENRGTAIKHAKRILAEAKKLENKEHPPAPSTHIHLVVESLKKIGSDRKAAKALLKKSAGE